MNSLLQYWKHGYYTEVFLILCIIIAIISCIKYFNKSKTHIYFSLYYGACFHLYFIINIIYYLDQKGKPHLLLTETSNTLFQLIELFVFAKYLFLQGIIYLKEKHINRIIYAFTVFSSMFLLWIFMPTTEKNDINRFSYFLTVLEQIILLALTLIYFLTLFKRPTLVNLTKTPSFWISTVLLFYCLISIPFFTVANDILPINVIFFSGVFACHTIFLALLVLTTTLVFIWKKLHPIS